MRNSELFDIVSKAELSSTDRRIFEKIEESITDITPEGSNDYISINEYFTLVETLFPKDDTISTEVLRNYIESHSGKNTHDLFFLDGLSSLAQCLESYEGVDDLRSFKLWFYPKLMEILLKSEYIYKPKKLKVDFQNHSFIIQEDLPEVGVYLYIYKDGFCIRDELQDSINICKEIALKEYGVPLDIWKEEA